ncbi:hypothetical protein [Anoxybacteroides tepidamans]|uniref:hypothetical protein n=1 Tax=Anoxybacteroides tepidamans TaxID=265948 RepID=UPI00048528CB|nr:hypothetical protein [Anoxybacillus tepidamans]
MRTVKLYLLLALFILLMGCQLGATSFQGESKNWSAEVVLQQNGAGEDRRIVLKYKGKDVDTVGRFQYSLQSTDWSTSKEGIELNKEGIYVDNGEISANAPDSGEKLTMTIEWDGKAETFRLEQKK